MSPVFQFSCISACLACTWQNAAPHAPLIREPRVDGQIVAPCDVHMEAAPFESDDAERRHVASDWAIVNVSDGQAAWEAADVRGPGKVHIHLGDGTFVGAHAGRTDLLFDTDYELRVRYSDDLGNWSDWSARLFRTGSPYQMFALELDNIQPVPPPRWTLDDGSALALPPAAKLSVRTERGDLLLALERSRAENPRRLREHGAVFVRLSYGLNGVDPPAEAWEVPASRLTFAHDQQELQLYLPALTIPAGERRTVWISDDGSSYWPDEAGGPFFGYDNVARASPFPFRLEQPGFRLEHFASGLHLPVKIAVVPQPSDDPDSVFMYATALFGKVHMITRDGAVSTYAEGLANFEPSEDIPGSGEMGATGLAIDPATGDLFVGLVYLHAHDANTGETVFHNKLIRLSSDDGGRTMARQQLVLDMPEPTGPAHQIGEITIGPDGALYAHVGDGIDTTVSRDLHFFRGKILRMLPDGSPPPDNPFYEASDGIGPADYVYALGFRNAFGAGWRQADGAYFSVENGPAIDRLIRVTRGRDYMWDGTDTSIYFDALHIWDPAVAPVGVVFVEDSNFGRGGFPEALRGHMLVPEFGPAWAPGRHHRGKRIEAFAMTADGQLAGPPTRLLSYSGVRLGRSTVSGLAFGPDGLYFSDFFKDLDYESPGDPGANIWRIRYVGVPEIEALAVTCPRDITVEARLTEGAFVEYSTPRASNAIGFVEVETSAPSGSLFPIGRTVVRCELVDEALRSAACEFAVEVRPPKDGAATGVSEFDGAAAPPKVIPEAGDLDPCGATAPTFAAATAGCLLLGRHRRRSRR
ncbi:MAG: hypothetical protein CHACPFDD_04028 [Phycisphaerae bacterium]|nr:hypothetical protein [Phycisphaerae bacterium]